MSRHMDVIENLNARAAKKYGLVQHQSFYSLVQKKPSPLTFSQASYLAFPFGSNMPGRAATGLFQP